MEEEKEIEDEVVAADEEDELFDYDQGLVSIIAPLAAVKSYISSQKRNHPILKQSLFETFVLRIRDEQYTSKLSNIADQFAYRALGTIKSEGTYIYGKESWARRKQKRDGKNKDSDENTHVEKKPKTDIN